MPVEISFATTIHAEQKNIDAIAVTGIFAVNVIFSHLSSRSMVILIYRSSPDRE
jgi:hypothetical protein